MPELLFPALTGLTLVFAGVLVGYFLWFRDRGDQLELSQQLAEENERLNTELRNRDGRVNKSKEKASLLNSKNSSLQQLCDDLLGSREKVQLQVNDLETELTAARTKLDRARDQLTEESRSRAKVEESQHLLKQQYMDNVAELEKTWKENCMDANNQLAQSKTESTRLLTLNDQLAEKLHISTSEAAKLRSELEAQREILETAKLNAAGLEKEYVGLESSMRSQIELVNEARGTAAAAASAQKLAEEAVQANHRQAEDLRNQVLDLQTKVTDRDNLKSRCEHLEASLAMSGERVKSVVEQRDSSLGKQDELQQEMIGLRARTENQTAVLSKLREEVEFANMQIRDLETEKRNLVAEIDRLKQSLSATEGDAQQQQASLLSQITSLESAKSNLQQHAALVAQQLQSAENSGLASQQELKTVIGDLDSQMKQLMSERNQLSQKLENLETTRSELTARIDDLETSNHSLGTQIDELVAAKEGLVAHVADLEDERKQLVSQKQELQSECTELTSLLSTAEEAGLAAQVTVKKQSERLVNTNHQLTKLSERLEVIQQVNFENQDDLIQRLRQLEQANGQLQAQCDRLSLELDNISSSGRQNLDQLIAQIQELEAANQHLSSETQRLGSELEMAMDHQTQGDRELQSTMQEKVQLHERLKELESQGISTRQLSDDYRLRMDAVLEQRDNAYGDLRELQAAQKRLVEHSKSNEETIRLLRRERGAILMRNRAMQPSFPRLHTESVDYSRGDELASEYGGTTKLDPVRGHVFVEAPRRHDDLKLIHGVAEVLERKLNGFGIYTFKQIMEWDDTAINEFSELLTFKDRIHRDDWQGQASKFYSREHQNRPNAA